MKKNYSIACTLQVLVIIVLSLLIPGIAQSQDLTEAQRKERCENNKNRLAELEANLVMINADLSKSINKKEIEDARTHMIVVRSLKFKSQEREAGKQFRRIAALYNFNYEACLYDADDGGSLVQRDRMWRKCLKELEIIIASKIINTGIITFQALPLCLPSV